MIKWGMFEHGPNIIKSNGRCSELKSVFFGKRENTMRIERRKVENLNIVFLKYSISSWKYRAWPILISGYEDNSKNLFLENFPASVGLLACYSLLESKEMLADIHFSKCSTNIFPYLWKSVNHCDFPPSSYLQEGSLMIMPSGFAAMTALQKMIDLLSRLTLIHSSIRRPFLFL